MELSKFYVEKNLFRNLIHLLEFELSDNKFSFYQSDKYAVLFEALYKNGDPIARYRTSELINNLGENGFYTYKSVYEEFLAGKFDVMEEGKES
jgi:hypothetical protein